MNAIINNKKQKMRTVVYICILIALLSLLVVASYTWFSISRTPSVREMAVYINSGTGLQLAAAYDAPDEGWGQQINFPDLVNKDTAPLKPVTWSEKQQSFMTIVYGGDGRMTEQYRALTDESNANRSDMEGYYVVGTFFARTDESCNVSLADAVEVNEGQNGAGTFVIGTPVWDGQSILHYDGGSGAETAVRLGFRITKIDPANGADNGTTVFYIYEPNCDRHLDKEPTGYVETPSIDGAKTLSDRLILQTASTWSEAYPVQRDVTIKSLGKFTTDTRLFSIRAGEMYRIQLYVWLEGQDIDCTNIVKEAQILANVQFTTEYSGQTGLQNIPG